MVALLKSIIKNLLKRPLADKSQRRRYLGNHAYQKKSYYGTVSGSHGRSFRIHHEKLREVPPGGEIMMTSYPACNKSLLSRKPCIADKHISQLVYIK